MAKKDRINTGIKNLDVITGGGFFKNSMNLLVGASGTGKTIFAIQFLIGGIENGEKVFFVTFEEKKEDVYSNMLEIGIDLQKLEDEEKFFFLEYTPEKTKSMLEEGGGQIENIMRIKDVQRVAIDSLASFEVLFEKEVDKSKAMLSLFNFLEEWEVTSLLTYEGTPDPKLISKVVEFESDSIIFLYSKKEKDLRKKSLEVFKMRGSKHSANACPYDITDKGIVIASV